MQFSNTVTINRSPRDVFRFLSHFENVPLWNYAISDTRRVGTRPSGVGARYVQTRTTPVPAVETFEVVHLDPDRAVAIRGTLGPFKADSTYELQAQGDATLLTNAMRLEPSGALRLIAPLTRTRLQAAVAENLHTLKYILERAAATNNIA